MLLWKEVGISGTSAIKYPEYYETLPELVIWSALCPDLNAVYVMHDFIPVYCVDAELSFSFAFLLKDNKITYIKRGEYIYEYCLLKEKKNTEMSSFFFALVSMLDKFIAEGQYSILKWMEYIELDFDLTEDELRSASWNPDPLFSVRGTCGQEKTCRKDCVCKKIYFESCCNDRRVEFSKIASITNPQY